MVRDGLELMYALSIENPYTRTFCFISRTYVLFFLWNFIVYIIHKMYKTVHKYSFIKKIKKSILKIF